MRWLFLYTMALLTILGFVLVDISIWAVWDHQPLQGALAIAVAPIVIGVSGHIFIEEIRHPLL